MNVPFVKQPIQHVPWQEESTINAKVHGYINSESFVAVPFNPQMTKYAAFNSPFFRTAEEFNRFRELSSRAGVKISGGLTKESWMNSARQENESHKFSIDGQFIAEEPYEAIVATVSQPSGTEVIQTEI